MPDRHDHDGAIEAITIRGIRTYALRRGVEPKTHQRTYRVIAVSADEAILVAHELFYREVVASNVGWAREIVDASAEWMASA